MRVKRSFKVSAFGTLILVGLIGTAFLFVRSAGLSKDAQGFLTRFEGSFRSGELRLIGTPTIQESVPGPIWARPLMGRVREYRITCPFERDGQPLWGVWCYTCNTETSKGSSFEQTFVYKFANSEATVAAGLPPAPWPLAPYIDNSMELIDGVPTGAGPAATIVSVTSPVYSDELATLVAEAPAGVRCELEIYPRGVISTPLPPQIPDENGIVKWSWSMKPNVQLYKEYNIVLLCIQKRGPVDMVRETRGFFKFVASERPKSTPEVTGE